MKSGKCRLCGRVAQLTKDHIQPSCAFNETTRRYVRLDNVVAQTLRRNQALGGPTVRGIYQEFQPDRPIGGGGIYTYTQCAACNNFLGSAYDSQFGRWCHDALDILKPGHVVLAQREYRQVCQHPLAILKRVVAMFFSINGDRFAGCQPELTRFVRNPAAAGLPDRFRVYAGYNINDLVSHIPFQQRLVATTGRSAMLSQIAHPPFVYVMAVDSECPDERLTDISGFAGGRPIEISMHVLPTNSCFAGDFRASGQLLEPDIAVFLTDLPPSYFRLVEPVV